MDALDSGAQTASSATPEAVQPALASGSLSKTWADPRNAPAQQTFQPQVVDGGAQTGLSAATYDQTELPARQDDVAPDGGYAAAARPDDQTQTPADPSPHPAFLKEKPAMNTSYRMPFDRIGDPLSASGAPTVIRAGLHLEGNIRTSDDILLEGSVRGEVTANSITIATGATLSGTVSAAVIVVDGTVEGVIRCMKLQVNTNGAVSGEIHHSVLVVEAGAAIEGTVFRTERSAEPAVSSMVAPVALAAVPNSATSKTESASDAEATEA